jgi:PAS domain S-box-containing protein
MYFTPINELKQTQQILQTIMNGAKNFQLAYLDPNVCYIHVNDAYAKSCGFTPEEMVGKRLFDLYSDYPETEATFKEAIKTLTPVERKDSPLVFPNQPERGVTYWDWTLKPITDAAGQLEGLVLSMVETTERKLAQQQLEEYATQMEQLAEQRAKELSRAERMAAIGETEAWWDTTFATAQAMRVNSTSAKKNSSIYQTANPRKTSKKAYNRSNRTILHIQNSRRPTRLHQTVNPPLGKNQSRKIIEEELLIVTVPNNLQVNIIIPRISSINRRSSHAQTRLKNLIQNAVQSMPNGGTLKIQTEHQNGAAAINISDTGTGIAPDIQPKISHRSSQQNQKAGSDSQ